MSFHTEVEAVCVRKLKEAGFRKRKHVMTLPLSEGWQGWVGLNSGGWTPQDGVMYPIIGVICDEIQRIYYDVQPELPGRNFATPTITIPLGYAADVPKLRQWFFTNDETVEDRAADLVKAVVDIGIPYMRKHASLDAIRATLSGDNMIPNPRVAREKLAIVIFMQDGPQAARAQVEADLAKFSTEDNAASEDDRRFAKTFFEYIDRRTEGAAFQLDS